MRSGMSCCHRGSTGDGAPRPARPVWSRPSSPPAALHFPAVRTASWTTSQRCQSRGSPCLLAEEEQPFRDGAPGKCAPRFSQQLLNSLPSLLPAHRAQLYLASRSPSRLRAAVLMPAAPHTTACGPRVREVSQRRPAVRCPRRVPEVCSHHLPQHTASWPDPGEDRLCWKAPCSPGWGRSLRSLAHAPPRVCGRGVTPGVRGRAGGRSVAGVGLCADLRSGVAVASGSRVLTRPCPSVAS